MRRHREHQHQQPLDRGFELLKKHRSPFPPEDLNPSDREAFEQASRSYQRAWDLKHILGGEVTPDAVADRFVEMAQQLHEHTGGIQDAGRNQLEEEIILLVSPLLGNDVGRGNVLQSARSGRAEHLEAYDEMIRSATVPDDIKQALAFIEAQQSGK